MWLDGLHSFYQGLNTHTIYSSFFGSLALGLISHYMARTKREPAIIFMVPGIIPLVPGGLAFDATKNLVLLDFSKAINTMLEVTLIAGAIALGLLFADQISKIILSGFARTRKEYNIIYTIVDNRKRVAPRARAFKVKLFISIIYHIFNFFSERFKINRLNSSLSIRFNLG